MIECPYRVVLADDHAMFRHGLKSVLDKKGDLDVIGEAADGLELLTILTSAKLAPHMAIIDISMPNLGGLEATCQNQDHPSRHESIDPEYAQRERIRP